MDRRFLKTFRQTLGLTQKQLAERIGVSRQLITAIESGRRKLQPYIIARIYLNFGAETVDRIREINNKYID